MEEADEDFRSSLELEEREGTGGRRVEGFVPRCRNCFAPNCGWGVSGAKGTAGGCWQCWRCAGGSCGAPVNARNALYCCACYCCCNVCVRAQLLAHSSGQQCRIVNHCGPYLIAGMWTLFFTSVSLVLGRLFFYIPGLHFIGCFFCMALATITRRNIRMEHDIGMEGSWIGDCFMANCPCTVLCNDCQIFRAETVESWDWWRAFRKNGCNCMDQESLGSLLRIA